MPYLLPEASEWKLCGNTLSGKLFAHLSVFDDTANSRMELLTKQMLKVQGVGEVLKAKDHIAWIEAMTNIRSAAE